MDYYEAIEKTKGMEGLWCKIYTTNSNLLDRSALYVGIFKKTDEYILITENVENLRYSPIKQISNTVFD